MIRLAVDGDVPALAALRATWVEENAGHPIDDPDYAENFAAWYAAERRQRVTWLAVVDDAPVGMLNLVVFTRMPKPGSDTTRWGYLSNFYVLPEYRGAGIGRDLLTACTAYADEHGFVRVVLWPSERSVPLYERDGFAPAVELMLRPGPD